MKKKVEPILGVAEQLQTLLDKKLRGTGRRLTFSDIPSRVDPLDQSTISWKFSCHGGFATFSTQCLTWVEIYETAMRLVDLKLMFVEEK